MTAGEGMSMTTGIYQTDSQDPVEQWIARTGRSSLNASATSMPIVNDSTMLRVAVRELLAARAERDALRAALNRATDEWFYRTQGERLDAAGQRKLDHRNPGWRSDSEVMEILKLRSLLAHTQEPRL